MLHLPKLHSSSALMPIFVLFVPSREINQQYSICSESSILSSCSGAEKGVSNSANRLCGVMCDPTSSCGLTDEALLFKHPKPNSPKLSENS